MGDDRKNQWGIGWMRHIWGLGMGRTDMGNGADAGRWEEVGRKYISGMNRDWIGQMKVC